MEELRERIRKAWIQTPRDSSVRLELEACNGKKYRSLQSNYPLSIDNILEDIDLFEMDEGPIKKGRLICEDGKVAEFMI